MYMYAYMYVCAHMSARAVKHNVYLPRVEKTSRQYDTAHVLRDEGSGQSLWRDSYSGQRSLQREQAAAGLAARCSAARRFDGSPVDGPAVEPQHMIPGPPPSKTHTHTAPLACTAES